MIKRAIALLAAFLTIGSASVSVSASNLDAASVPALVSVEEENALSVMSRARILDVEDRIDAIGKVTSYESFAPVATAYDAYCALTETEKEAVRNANVLMEDRETLYNILDEIFWSSAKNLRMGYDKVEDVCWFNCATQPAYLASRTFVLPYFGISGSKHYLNLLFNFYSPDGCYYDRAVIYADGVRYNFSFGKQNIIRLFEDDGWVVECVDFTNADVGMLIQIGHSEDVVVRFYTENNIVDMYRDYVMPKEDIQAINTMMKAYTASVCMSCLV